MVAKKTLSGRYWQQQKGESGAAFEAFRTYLSMGDGRSHADVGRELGKTKTIIDRWGSMWQWQERIRAYNNHLAAEEDARRKKEMRDRYDRFGKISDQLSRISATKLLKMTEKDMLALSPKEAAEYLRLAAHLAGEARNVFMPPEREVVQVEVARRRLDLEYLRFEAAQPAEQDGSASSNLLEALNGAAAEAWGDYEQEQEVTDDGPGDATQPREGGEL